MDCNLLQSTILCKEEVFMIEKTNNTIVDEEAEWKSQVGWDNLNISERMELLELEGKFDVDVLNDPPTKPLLPNQIDYEQKKLMTKIKSRIANWTAQIGINGFIKKKQLIIKEVKGLENWKNLNAGAIITCNHFGANDSFIMQKIFKYSKKKKMFRIIREGNYTNPPVLKFFMRNCDVLPLSSNSETMKKFLRAVNNILQRGDYVLIYPEESMWPNYRKPKPLKDGGFRFAVKNNVPVLPIFITMEDSDVVGEDGAFLQAHTVHILPPIYAKQDLSVKENIEYMKKSNYNAWVEVYEKFYGKKLEYTTKTSD